MKKIRLLALLLAILMIPFSVLFACKPDDEPDDEDKDDDKDKNDQKQEVVVERDDDNDLQNGELLNYHFNAAAAGRFPALTYGTELSYMDIQKEPYATSFILISDKAGASYRIEKKTDPATNLPTTDGCMLIKREAVGTPSDPFVDIAIDGVITGLQAQHMLQFDIRLEKGLITSDAYVGLRKELGSNKLQKFLTIKNGAIYDCNGTLIYGEPSKNYKEGWHTITILVNDDVDVTNYDVYVDGTKVAETVKYNVADFWNYDQAKPQRYRISLGTSGDEEYLYLDNIKLCNGTAKTFGLENAPKDLLVTPGENNSMLPAYDSMFDPMSDPAATMGISRIEGKLKNDIFSSNLLLSNVFSITKITSNSDGTDVFEDLFVDYGVFTGKYAEKSKFGKGNEEFTVWTEANNDNEYTANALNRISYDNDKTDETPAVTGTYVIAAVGSVQKVIKITWDEGVTAPVVGSVSVSNLKCDDNQNLFIYSNEECTATVEGAYVLSTTGDANYAKNLIEQVKSQLGANERLAVKWTNFYTFGSQRFTFSAPKDKLESYEYITFEFYASQRMVDDSYQFMFLIPCPQYGSGQYAWVYFQPEATKNQAAGAWYNADGRETFQYNAGWNTLRISTEYITTHSKYSGGYLGEMGLNISYWQNGIPVGDIGNQDSYQSFGTEENGYTLYISHISFEGYVSEPLAGVPSDMLDCTHANTSVVRKECETHKPCQHGAYLVNRCDDCGYEEIGAFVEIAEHHKKSTQLLTFNATCEKEGYTYRECVYCGEHIVENVIPKKSHEVEESMDWTTLMRTALCKNCGSVEYTRFFDKLISAQEKIELYDIPANQTFSYSSYNGQIPYQISGYNMITLQNSATIEPFSVNGVTGFEFTRVDTQDPTQMQHSFFDILPGQRGAPYGVRLLAGKSFTFEMDVMLGKKGRDGKYPRWRIDKMIDRSPEIGDISLVVVDENGIMSFQGTSFTMPLSETEYTNLAFFVNPAENKIQLYVNGYLKAEKDMFASVDVAMKFQFCDVRIQFDKHFSTEEMKLTSDELKATDMYKECLKDAGGSFKFNNVMYYYSDAPGCYIDTDLLAQAEYSGDIELQDELFNAMNFNPLNVNSYDVIAKLPAGINTSMYVMQFKLTSENLNAGVLLEGWKMKSGLSYYEALLYVGADGKIYALGDRLVSETGEVNIALVFNDSFGTVTVYVNGVELYDGTIQYSSALYTDRAAVITGFVFKNDCGAYQISEFSLHTGATLK